MPTSYATSSATGTAGKSALTTDETVIFDGAGEYGCDRFSVVVPSGSTSDVLVRVEPLHKTDEFMLVVKGERIEFEHGGGGLITKVIAKGDGGAATVGYGVVRREPQLR